MAWLGEVVTRGSVCVTVHNVTTVVIKSGLEESFSFSNICLFTIFLLTNNSINNVIWLAIQRLVDVPKLSIDFEVLAFFDIWASSTFYILVLFIPKHLIVEAFLIEQPSKSCKIYFSQKKIENLGKHKIKIWVLKKFKWLISSE